MHRRNPPPPNEWIVRAVRQTVDGPLRHLRGRAELENAQMLLRADEIDFNDDTGDAEARGRVFFQNFERNERIWADRIVYNTHSETGKFYNVRGSARPRIDARPGLLTSTEPYYFQGEWAERLGEKYVLHNGFLTNCKMPRPWWRLKGPKFDIIPEDRAIAYHSVFIVRKFPLFYTPFFYKSLERVPRRSGILTPNIGNSSTRGKMLGIGYFWAINRSYDATYQVQDFTARGFAHHIDVRGKPKARTDFDAIFFGVQDKGLQLSNGDRIKQGGFSIYATAKADLGDGFQARGVLNYLSSLTFRQAFTESFNEAVFAEVHSVGFINKNWSYYTFNVVLDRLENFQDATPGNSVLIRRLPEFRLSSRDRQITDKFPVWFSLDTSGGLLDRSQPLFQTRQFTPRLDFRPTITTAIRWKQISLIPSFSIQETHYGESQKNGQIISQNITRSAREFHVDLILPSLARTFNQKTWLGDKLKHVIEPRASYHYVGGIDNFDRIIRFDELDLLSNTSEAEISLTNRLYAKRNDQVFEVLSWQLTQARYFDPTFGGALQPGQRNVIASTIGLTPYTFLDGVPRGTSPVVSIIRASPRPGFGVEWRADYDPLRGEVVDSGLNADFHFSRYFISAGHNQVHTGQVLSPSANQFRGSLGFGNDNRRGWNAAFVTIYDYRQGRMQYAITQVTYNTDCCGFSVQYRRFSFGTRNENQFRLAFAVANIGSFGTMKKQERLF